jgi:hypothetical protein
MGTSLVSSASEPETTQPIAERSGKMLSRLRLAIIGAATIVAMSACALATQTSSAPWSPASVTSAITVRSASAQVASGAKSYQLAVTASCHADEQLLGGGFDASNVFEYALFLHASYPASNAWTVKTNSISHYELDVYAYCLRGQPSLGTKIVAGADCPAGNTALSHGKTDDGQVTLCSAQHVASVTRIATPITLHAAANGYLAQSARAECPAGTVALDGGSTIGMALASKATSGLSGWEATAGGDGAGEVYANCVTLA